MSYLFAIFMVLVAMVGGAWMYKLSNDNYDAASFGYAIVGLIWVAICLSLAGRVIP